MKSINKVIMLGNLTANPELKNFEEGKKLAKFSIATNRFWVDKDGEKKQSVEFHNIIAWQKLADIAEKFLQKGDPVLIVGHLSNSSYQNKDGVKMNKTEILADEINCVFVRKTAEATQ